MSTLLLTLAVGFISSFYPGLPIEPYVVGVVAATEANAIAVGVAAAIGQSAGKTGMFLAARGTVQIPALKRWVAKRRKPPAEGEDPPPDRWWRRATRWIGVWSRKLAPLDKPGFAIPTVLLSAFVGIPPLLIITFAAAATKMRTVNFVLACLGGRTIRLVLIALTPAAAGYLFG